MKKIFLKTMLCFIAVFMSMTVVFAEGEDVNITDSGTCGANGDNLTWVLDSEGVLTISGEGEMENYSSGSSPWYNNTNIKTVIIEDGLTSIDNFAFCKCESLTSITIPNSVTTIGESAFSFCSNMTDICISDLTAWCNIDFNNLFSNPLYYAHNLYLNGELIKDLVIPDNITSIGNYVFEGCDNLKGVRIHDNVTGIGDRAFAGCTGLTSVTIPDSVISIGSSAFGGCSNLTNVIISNNITSISVCLFFSCDNLTRVTIPDSITNIGNYAFDNCGKLKDIYYTGSEEQWKNIDIGAYGNEMLKNTVIHYNSIASSAKPSPIPLKKLEIVRTDTTDSSEYTFTITPKTAYENCYVYVAVYDTNGTLLTVNYVPLTILGKTSVSAPKSTNDMFVKVFVWKDFTNMIPICNPEVIKINNDTSK